MRMKIVGYDDIKKAMCSNATRKLKLSAHSVVIDNVRSAQPEVVFQRPW